MLLQGLRLLSAMLTPDNLPTPGDLEQDENNGCQSFWTACWRTSVPCAAPASKVKSS